MIDPTNLNLSSIWDPITGFGGNGSVSDGCVQGGPLQNILLNYTEDGYNPHCLNRNLTETNSFYGGESETIRDIINNAKTYEEFRKRLEKGPHKRIHMGIDGEMKTAFSTNGEIHFTPDFVRENEADVRN
jgi:tyrosinase